MSEWRGRIDDSGDLQLPDGALERIGVEAGDEVFVRTRKDKILIEKTIDPEKLAEGYRRRAKRDARIAAEMDETSREANVLLGDAPKW